MPTNPLIELVECRLSELRESTYDELLALVKCQSERIERNGKVFTLSIWNDLVGEQEIRIVVQAYSYLLFGIGRMAADGFRIEKTGNIKKLSREELYAFM